MAENKKSFVLYADMIHTVKKMPKAKQAHLFLTILEYVNDLDPEVDDLIVSLVWEPIKQQLKRDLKKYEDYKAKQAENGKLGGRPKKIEKPKRTQKTQAFISETQKSLNDNVTVNVNDTVIVTDNVNEKEISEYGDKSPHTHTEDEKVFFKKFNAYILKNAPRVAQMKQPFTIDEFLRLKMEFSNESISNILSAMQNRADLIKKYVSANLTLRNWIKNERTDTLNNSNGKSNTAADLQAEETARILAQRTAGKSTATSN